MTVAPQTDQEIVQGTVQGIVQKGQNRWQVEVNVGQQNPRRLWTDDQGVVQQMTQMIGQTLSFMCRVSHWTNNSGQPVRSLWINGYGQPGQAAPVQQQPMQQPMMQQPQQQWQQPQPAPQATAPIPAQPAAQQDSTEDKIHRQTATKVAVHLLKHLKPEDQNFQNLIALSERLVAYYDHGVQWGGDQGNPSGSAVADGDPGPQDIPHTDDDIPF